MNEYQISLNLKSTKKNINSLNKMLKGLSDNFSKYRAQIDNRTYNNLEQLIKIIQDNLDNLIDKVNTLRKERKRNDWKERKRNDLIKSMHKGGHYKTYSKTIKSKSNSKSKHTRKH